MIIVERACVVKECVAVAVPDRTRVHKNEMVTSECIASYHHTLPPVLNVTFIFMDDDNQEVIVKTCC